MPLVLTNASVVQVATTNITVLENLQRKGFQPFCLPDPGTRPVQAQIYQTHAVPAVRGPYNQQTSAGYHFAK